MGLSEICSNSGTILELIKYDIKEIIRSLLASYEMVPESLRSKFVLVGSLNQALQGVDVLPKKDIDWATDYQTVLELIRLFRSSLKSFCDNRLGDDNLPFAYLYVDIQGVEVEFFDAISFGKSNYKGYLKPENLVTITVKDKKLIGLDLKSELKVCRKAEKSDKVEAIKCAKKTPPVRHCEFEGEFEN